MTNSQKPRFRLIAGRPVEAKPRVRLVLQPSPLERAIAYVRERGIYILDRGTPAPKWGTQQKGRA